MKKLQDICKSNEPLSELMDHSFTLDWICTADSREILEKRVLPTVIKFLDERGLELSKEKTRITNINEGFDFLGFNVRKYREKLLIKPSKKGITTFLKKVRKIIQSRKADKAGNLIQTLNPKIRGWVNYFQHSVAKKIFSQIDHSIFQALWKWMKRRHPKKSATWIKSKYFTHACLKSRFFHPKKEKKIILVSASETRIVRHVKIKSAATPYDPEFREYFLKRRKYKTRSSRAMPYSLRRARAV